MPKWPTKPLGDLCQLINGRAFKPTDWGTEGLRIVRIQNLNDHEKPFNFYSGEYRDAHYIDDGEILLSWSGTPGTSFGCFRWLRGPGLLNQHIFRVMVNDSVIDGDFFIYAVNSKLDEMIGKAHGGVGLRHITKGKLEAIHLPVPSLNEQRRVVNRINECLSRVSEIEKLRGEQSDEAAELPDALIEALIDEDWDRLPLCEVASDVRNGWSGKEHPHADPVRVLKLSCVHDRHIDVNESKLVYVPQGIAADFFLKRDDVFIVRGNGSPHLVGRSAIADQDESDVIFNDLLIRIRFKENVLPAFANAVLHSRKAREQILATAKTAAGIWKINQQHLAALKIPVPSIAKQKRLVEMASTALAAARSVKGELQQCETSHLRESILRRAFAGEL